MKTIKVGHVKNFNVDGYVVILYMHGDYNWVAKDEDGCVHAYYYEPEICDNDEEWISCAYESRVDDLDDFFYDIDWRESKRELF